MTEGVQKGHLGDGIPHNGPLKIFKARTSWECDMHIVPGRSVCLTIYFTRVNPQLITYQYTT